MKFMNTTHLSNKQRQTIPRAVPKPGWQSMKKRLTASVKAPSR